MITYILCISLLYDPGTWQWLLNIAGPFLIVQALGGILGLITLVIVTRRFLSTDFPAAMSGVNKRLDDHTKLFERLDLDIRKLVLDVSLLNERHGSLRGRVDRLEEREERERLDLDDTRTRRRPRRETNGE